MKRNRYAYTTRGQRALHFFLGFFGWYLGNGVLFALGQTAVRGILPGLTMVSNELGVMVLLVAGVPLLVNLAALILLGLTRYWAAFGLLGAFALSLALLLAVTLWALKAVTFPCC